MSFLSKHLKQVLWAVSIIALLFVYLTPETVLFRYPGFSLNLSHVIAGLFMLGIFILGYWKIMSWEDVSNYIVMFLVFLFLLSHFPADLILLNTTTTGGDTGSDNYLAQYLKDYLIPHGQLIGWTMARWCGYPMFQFQFILPFLVMVLMSYVIPLNVAFKIVTLSGVFTLPLFTYLAMRYIGFKFPTPIISAIFSLSFLFQEKNTVFGGNIPSMLAGEFSYSISFSFMILFLGALYKAVAQGRFSIYASVLFVCVALSHACTTITAALISIFFVFDTSRKKIVRNVTVLAEVYVLAFLLLAFFLVPLVAKIFYTTDYGGDWDVRSLFSWYQLPDAYVFHVFAALGILVGLIKRDKKALFLSFAFLMSVFSFFNGEALKTANVRFFPMMYFFVLLLAAYAVGELASRMKGRWVIPIILCLGVMIWINTSTTFIDGWTKWNYEGFQSKSTWPQYEGIMGLVDGTPGRLHNDLSNDNNRFGTPRAFESTPYFSNKSTLEEVYAQATISSPYVSYFQCEMSQYCAGIPRVESQERTTTYDPVAGKKHAQVLNVKDYVAVYDKLKTDLSKDSDWKLIGTFGQHEVFNLQTNKGNYVEVPAYEPVLVETSHWRGLSLEWYTNLDNIDVPLAFVSKPTPEDLSRFKTTVTDDNKAQLMLRESLLKPEFINEWLVCGTFPNPRDRPLTDADYWNLSLDHGLEKDYIGEQTAAPELNGACSGNKWTSELANSQGYVDLRLTMNPKEEVIAYANSYVYSPTDRTVKLLYGSDDGAKLFLNGELVKDDHTHRAAMPDIYSTDLKLKKGWNRLLIKVEQLTGGWGFYARIVDLNDKAIPDLVYQSDKPLNDAVPAAPAGAGEGLSRISLDNHCTIDEQVTNEEITFNTSCIGKPHIVKVSYYPNWKVEGADKIYIVSPSFMLVYPNQKHVRIYYGETTADTIGNALTVIGLIILAALLVTRYWKKGDRKNTQRLKAPI